MQPVEIFDDFFWVGALDWEDRDFHGYAVAPRGTTYNAYLIKDEKTTLFDTVKPNHQDEYFCSIAHLAKPEEIDYLVINHLEPDHAGAIIETVERYKPEKIFVSPMGKKALESIYHVKDWPVEVVKTGDTLSLGKRSLKFMETRMLHWPDNMATYVPEHKLLISSDAFGQNIASYERYADEIEPNFLEHAMAEYYANIVLPYSPQVLKVLDTIEEMKFDISMIAPDHGLILRGDDVCMALKRYREYAMQKPTKNAVVIYDTMWHSTEHMAHAIADGIASEGVSPHIQHVKSDPRSIIMTRIFRAGAVVLGSPTHNNGILSDMAAMLNYMKGLRPQNKVAGVFGSFGWSGESVKVLSEWVGQMKGLELVGEGVKHQNRPDHGKLKECFEYGQRIAQALKAKIEQFK